METLINKNETYYLAFESSKVMGMMEKLTLYTLKILFTTQTNKKLTECVIVSACHSQKIGEMMRDCGIPIVICINDKSKIDDEAAMSFSQAFYQGLTLGMSYGEAFQKAKENVKSDVIHSCCCAHPHKGNCKWKKKAKEIGDYEAHLLHVPNCNCDLPGNFHYFEGRKLCDMARLFLEEFNESNELDDFNDLDYYESFGENSEYATLCCCSPELPHDESMKFILLCDQKEYLDMKPFENLEDGKINIINQLPTENEPVRVGNLPAVGRNTELQNIVDSLSYTSTTENRLVHIYGKAGVGKSFLAKHASKYLFERHNFDDGCAYIQIKNKYAVGENLSTLICHALGLPTANRETLCRNISKWKMLIILDKSSKITSLDYIMLNRTIEYFLDNTDLPKIIAITDNENDITVDRSLHLGLNDLDSFNAAQLLLQLASQCIDEYSRDIRNLAKHDIFTIITTNPTNIVRFSQYLKSTPNTLDAIVFQEKEKLKSKYSHPSAEDEEESDDSSWVIKQSYDLLIKSHGEKIIILYVICQLPSGVLESDLDAIFSSIIPTWRAFISALIKQEKKQILNSPQSESSDEENNQETSWLITSKKIEEINEFRYYAYQVVYSYINKKSMTQSQGKEACSLVLCHLSALSRKIMRSMRRTEIKILSLFKFTALVDVGIWSDEKDFTNPDMPYLKYQDLMDDPNVFFTHHESNIQKFCDIEFLQVAFPVKEYRYDLLLANSAKETQLECSETRNKKELMDKLIDLMLTFPTLLIIQSRKEEALYCLEGCMIICEKYHFAETKAVLTLMIASIYLNDKHTEFIDSFSKAKTALNIFIDLDCIEGKAEANFLLGMLCHKKNRILAQSERISLQRQAQSENPYDEAFDHIPHFSKRMTEIRKVSDEQKNYLNVAKRIFVEIGNEYGLARVSLAIAICELQEGSLIGGYLDYTDSTSLNLSKEDNPELHFKEGNLNQEIEKCLYVAKEGFEKFKDHQNLISCYLKIGEYKLAVKDFAEAKNYTDEADSLYKFHNEYYFRTDCVSLLDRINENIRKESLNVFVFLNASPLVDPFDRMYVGSITQSSSNLEESILSNLKNQNKVIKVKFEVLTRESLLMVKDHGCRVLHLSSDVFSVEELWTEQENGALDLINIEQLREIIFPAGARLTIDVVLLAIPNSMVLAEIFVALGVPHVICFNFSEEFLESTSSSGSHINAPYACMNSFSKEFYKRLVKGNSVQQSCNHGRGALKKCLKEINKQLQIFNLNDKMIGDGSVLLPEDFDHEQSLYGHKHWESTELKKGELVNISRSRGPTNILKVVEPLTGRKIEIHKAAKYLSENKIVSFTGPRGIGKTHLAHSVANFLNLRYQFLNGIYYFDLKSVNTAEQCKKLLKNEKIEYRMDNTLLIFDHIDEIWRKHGPQFRWWLIDLVDRFKANILLISRIKIKSELKESDIIQVKSLVLEPLNDYESADLLISKTTSSQRIITLEELYCDKSKMTLHKALQNEPNLTNCQGIPEYILLLADLLNYNTFDTISIKHELPYSKNRHNNQRKKTQKNSENKSNAQTAVESNLKSNKKKKGKEKKSNIQNSSRNHCRKHSDLDAITVNDTEKRDSIPPSKEMINLGFMTPRRNKKK